jgi:hypothetical protein
VQSALLYYKIKGNGTWNRGDEKVLTANTTHYFSDTIPASSVTTEGVYYYIKAEDTNGIVAYKPTDGQSLPYLITVSGAEATGTPPSITGWNNITKNAATAITVNESEAIYFNVTANQVIDYYNWYKDGSLAQNSSSNEYTTSWSNNGTYSVSVNATNANGTSNTVAWTVTVTAADTVPPVITSVQSAPITHSSATITWTTDEISDSRVKYGTTSESYTKEVFSAADVTEHNIPLEGLSASITYYYVVNSTDLSGNPNESEEYSFNTTSVPTGIFDTGSGGYPSIRGNHTGTIKLNQTMEVSRMYTYPCFKTDGHTEYVRFDGHGIDVNKTWIGTYLGAYQWIEFDAPFTLDAGVEYNYTIITGCYPQIIHKPTHHTDNGWINCTKFVDANGKEYDNWIPAIRLE